MRRHGLAGMTLLEVIFSLWILFLAIVFATAALHRLVASSRSQEQLTRAAFLAQEKMEELTALPAAAVVAGTGYFDSPLERYQWRVIVTPLSGDRAKMLEVTVEVTTPVREVYTLKTHRRGRSNRLWFASNAPTGQLSRLRTVLEDGTELSEVDTASKSCNDSWPCPSPDGKQIAFLSDREKSRQIFVMPSNSSKPPEALTHHPIGVQDFCWSPKGDKIAYTAYSEGFSQIYVLDVLSKKSEPISRKGIHEGCPSWSSQGDRIVFTTMNGGPGGTQIAMMSTDGSDRRVLSDQPGWNTSASFSPSGDKVVFMSNRDADSEIFLLDLRGADGLRQLTDTPGYDNSPRFSPDGKRIVFSSDRRGSTELYLMEADGENQRPLIEKASRAGQDVFDKEASWEPATNIAR